MESSPSYSPQERGNSRDRDGKERSYQPPQPAESMFVDPRREEAPRAPLRTPLEGVIHIRPATEAAQGYMQQQLEQAEKSSDKDKDDKRDERASAPVIPEPTAPAEARPTVEPSEASILDQQEYTEPLAAEQELPEQEQQLSASTSSNSEQLAVQPEPTQEDQPLDDGVQRAWYYTPPRSPAQPSAAEYPAASDYSQEQPGQPPGEAPQLLTETEPAAWHYGTEQQPVSDQSEKPAPYATWETSEPVETPGAASTSSNSLFGARTPQGPYEYAAASPPASSGGGDGSRPPRSPFEGDYGSAAPAPVERYAYAASAATPSTRLERLVPHEHPHTHRGLALGIAGGLLVEHILAKRRDNKLSERIDKLQKENNKAQEQAHWASQELQQTQQALRTEQQYTQEEIAKLRTTPAAKTPAYVPTAETRADVSGPAYAAASAAAAHNMAPNSPIRTMQPEQRPVVVPGEQPPDPNQQQEYVDQNGNTIRLRPGERIKHSAWHTYVEKDGHVVEDAIDYGRGFHQEQQQELGHTPQFGTDQAGMAQGPVFGASQDVYGTGNPSLPSGMTAPSLPTGQPTHVDAQHQLPEHTKSGKQIASNFANPWFWLMLALIFAAFFITITV